MFRALPAYLKVTGSNAATILAAVYARCPPSCLMLTNEARLNWISQTWPFSAIRARNWRSWYPPPLTTCLSRRSLFFTRSTHIKPFFFFFAISRRTCSKTSSVSHSMVKRTTSVTRLKLQSSDNEGRRRRVISKALQIYSANPCRTQIQNSRLAILHTGKRENAKGKVQAKSMNATQDPVNLSTPFSAPLPRNPSCF